MRDGAAEHQAFVRRVALDPSAWSAEAAAGQAALFDATAAVWEEDRGGYRRPPMADALARGGPFLPGRVVEVASGTGLLTPLLAAVWGAVVAVDVSSGMLARSSATGRVRADASCLPLPDRCAAAVAIGDGPLFAAEVDRVLVDGGALVWSNALGDGAPFHLPTVVLVAAMADATGRPWSAVTSEAHWGSWAVLRAAG